MSPVTVLCVSFIVWLWVFLLLEHPGNNDKKKDNKR